ncbi:MAG: hypothetical protein WCG45_02615, partial [bacterium]
INDILRHFESLSDTKINYPKKLKDDRILLNEWLDSHIYQPLLKEDKDRPLSVNSNKIINSIRPPGLNLGEYSFVQDLKNFIAAHRSIYPDYDFYLLRNLSKGVGFGFYFLSGGFYPDFMLWLKHKTSGKQYLSFIDPHGLRNEQQKWDSSKINLHKTIKLKEREINNPNLILNSFVLQPPPENLFSTGLDGWHREDDPMRQIPLDDYASQRNVFAITIDGTESGINGYINKMISKIIND